MTGRLDGFDFDVLFEVKPGTEDVYPLRQVVFDHPIAGRQPVPILDRMKDNPTALSEYLREQGIEGAKPVHVFATPDEIPWLTNLLLSAVGTTPGGKWQTLDVHAQRIGLVVRAGVNETHFRAVAKIAFHYALKVLPDLTGFEPEFNAIKQFIWEGGHSNRFVHKQGEQFVLNFRQGYRPSCWSHILAVTCNYNEIVGYTQFFAGPRSLPLPYRIRIGSNPSRIISRTIQHAHQFIILPQTEKSGYIGVMEDLQPANYVSVGIS